MKYVVDKNTNRMIYQVPVDGKYIVDEHSYLVEADSFVLAHRAWNYRWVGGAFVFVEPPKPRAVAQGAAQSVTPRAARKGRVLAKPVTNSA